MKKGGIIVPGGIVGHVQQIMANSRKACASFYPVDSIYGDYYFEPCNKSSELALKRAISKAKRIYNEEAIEQERATGVKVKRII